MYGFISHISNIAGSGHYLCFVKHKTKSYTWIKYDDGEVAEYKEHSEEFRNNLKIAYIVFYERKWLFAK